MTTELTLKSGSGKDYVVELPEPKPNFESKYVFAFAKSGSTLLDNLISVYCQQVNVPTFSLFNQAFGQGIVTANIGVEALRCFQPQGYLYTGFRHYPNFELDICKNKAIWLVRDPRDMAVSMYYSITKSHLIPKGLDGMQKTREEAEQTSIDDFVRKSIISYIRQFLVYQQKLQGKKVKVYRYEDIIYHKREWFMDVLDTLEIEIRPELVDAVVRRFDIIPDSEQSDQHVRQVHPGNFRKKLSSETIEIISSKASQFLKHYNYAE